MGFWLIGSDSAGALMYTPVPTRKKWMFPQTTISHVKGVQLPFWNNHLFLVVWGSRLMYTAFHFSLCRPIQVWLSKKAPEVLEVGMDTRGPHADDGCFKWGLRTDQAIYTLPEIIVTWMAGPPWTPERMNIQDG